MDRLLPFMFSVPQDEELKLRIVLEADRQPCWFLSSSVEEERPLWWVEGTPLEKEDQPYLQVPSLLGSLHLDFPENLR